MNAARLKKLGWTRDAGEWPHHTGEGPKWTHKYGAVIQGYISIEHSRRRWASCRVRLYRLELAPTIGGQRRYVNGAFAKLEQAVDWHFKHELAGIAPPPGSVALLPPITPP